MHVIVMHVLIQWIQTWPPCSSVCFSSLSGVSQWWQCIAACVNLNDPSLFWPVCEEAWPAQCCCCATQWSVLWRLVDCTPPGSGCVSEPDPAAQSGTSLLVHWWTPAWLSASSRSFPRVCSYRNAVCELLHAITESSASGGSLSLELFCRSNFIHQTQVYFPPPRDFARSLHTSA